MRVTYLRVCAHARSGARVDHASRPPRPRQCTRPQHGQTALPAHAGRNGAIDRLQASQVRVSHHGQGTCYELLMHGVFMCVCLRACVCSVSNILKYTEPNKFNKGPKQICEIPLLSLSQDRDPEVSGLHEIAVKRLGTRVGNPCIDTLAHIDMQIETDMHADRLKQYAKHAQIRLPSRLWILFVMLLINMAPFSCSAGACANAQS